MLRQIFFTVVTLIFVVTTLCSQSVSLNLKANWVFREQDESKWYPAQVPGEVHTDLYRNKCIPDPYYRDNEKKLQWIDRENYEYKTTFNVLATLLQKKHVELVFEGLDTYATVYLNGVFLFSADNMFIPWKSDVKAILKPGKNELYILFRSAQNIVDSMARADVPYIIPDNPRCYVRKAQYSFGWDWGPKFTTCGIWKNVHLDAYDVPTIETAYTKPVDVRLVETADEKGSSFYFSINGKPVYMKGANYIPSDAFLSRMNRNEYRKVLMRAKDANMNMLRIWGGGIYENDDFYDLCDSLGIFIWQDFMFAGTMVPGSEDFFQNVKKEVNYQIKRLRKHKSIVIWCGNNEIEEAFYRWGWHRQFKISSIDSVKLWNDYKRLFKDSIPAWLSVLDPYRPYISTSPRYGWGVDSSVLQGDSHYWGTWWGLQDFEIFSQKTGRFISEYGMQAMPNYSSVLKYSQPQDRYLYSDILLSHQKAGNGFLKLNHYLQQYIIDTALLKNVTVEDYVYLTQCVQYYGFKNMILIHRSKTPYNMGTLLWQLNDCWPVASWSITDYYNRMPKAAWYAVKEAYKDNIEIKQDMIRPRNADLKNPNIQLRIDNNALYIKASAVAKYVYIQVDGYEDALSDNYFDLAAGEEKKITLSHAKKVLPAAVHIRSLYDVYNKYKFLKL